MPAAPARLVALRTNTAAECAANGYVVRGALLTSAVGGPCTLTCQTFSTVFQLDIAGGGGHFFIPYSHGEARYCDIPRGRPNGTLVVTTPMNGCALEVHRRTTGNRFYHDADGNSMPAVDARYATRVFRADAAALAPNNKAETIFNSFPSGADNPEVGVIGQNFEHTVVCVKNGARWDVYQTAVVTTLNMATNERIAFKVGDGPPVHLGHFDD